MRWLALDVGSRIVGVATCDSEERVVTALPAIPFSGPRRLAAEIERLVADWQAGGVVVGLPVTRSGQGRGERRVAQVVAELGARLTVPVEVEDERGTTHAAEELLAQAGVPRRRWPALVDSLAARFILEGRLARGGESSD